MRFGGLSGKQYKSPFCWPVISYRSLPFVVMTPIFPVFGSFLSMIKPLIFKPLAKRELFYYVATNRLVLAHFAGSRILYRVRFVQKVNFG